MSEQMINDMKMKNKEENSERVEDMEENEGGEDDQGLMFVQEHDQGVDEDGDVERNYKCAIDPQTGNLLLMEEDDGADGGDYNNDHESAATSVLRVLENGEYILESFHSLHPFQPVAKTEGVEDEDQDSEEELPEDGDDREGGESDNNDLFVRNNRRTQSPQREKGAFIVPQRKESFWHSRKVFDLIRCIQNHEQKFRKWSKIMKVWSIISADMRELGHSSCNKDDCSKKWSNLHRTWKTIRLRPKELRTKWKYYDDVSNLIKSLSGRHRELGAEDRKAIISDSTRVLMMRLMAVTKTHQDAIRGAEEEFKSKVDKLDEERDRIICDIKSILQCVDDR